jgi:hypothetical protein
LIVTKIYKCEEGHNFIVLDKDLDDIENINADELSCPICRKSAITGMCRVIQIGH